MTCVWSTYDVSEEGIQFLLLELFLMDSGAYLSRRISGSIVSGYRSGRSRRQFSSSSTFLNFICQKDDFYASVDVLRASTNTFFSSYYSLGLFAFCVDVVST